MCTNNLKVKVDQQLKSIVAKVIVYSGNPMSMWYSVHFAGVAVLGDWEGIATQC